MPRITRHVEVVAALVLCLATAAHASTDYGNILTPAHPGLPLANPIADNDIPPPPFSLVTDRPVNPAYVPGLPGLPQARIVVDDHGSKRPKFDGVFIRKSRVENGEVIIPAGGLAYLEDTLGGEVALRGEPIPVLGRMATYIDYDMSIVVKENVTIPAGQGAVVGGTVYNYYATVGHEQMANHSLHVRTIAGTDWEWAFGSPSLSSSETSWYGSGFAQLYNQGQAREVSRDRIVFDWISGVRTDRMLLADNTLYSGLAKVGQEWQAGDGRVVKVADLDEAAGTVRIQVVDGGEVKLDRVLGPVDADRLIEDSAARKALVFEYHGIAGYLVPARDAIKDGHANLRLYTQTFDLKYGDTYARDTRFAVYPVGCPTGHGFGFMLVNKDEIRIAPGGAVEGPESYFKVVVERIAGNAVTAWHIEDRNGARSVNLGGPGVANVDLVLGQGRVAGQAILKDVGRAMLARNYDLLAARPAAEAGMFPFSIGQGLGGVVLLLSLTGFAYELGRRKKVQ
jgi:hypothetical protein